jgi:hypothetical protein
MMSESLTDIRRTRPGDVETPTFYRGYLSKVPPGDVLETLTRQRAEIAAWASRISQADADVVHAPFTWRVRTVVEHCVDAERVFGYRILRIAAGDQTRLPGWDENAFAKANYGPSATIAMLVEEFVAVRTSTVCLLSRLTPTAWQSVGNANGYDMSTRLLAWIAAGHFIHHDQKLRERLGR